MVKEDKWTWTNVDDAGGGGREGKGGVYRLRAVAGLLRRVYRCASEVIVVAYTCGGFCIALSVELFISLCA